MPSSTHAASSVADAVADGPPASSRAFLRMQGLRKSYGGHRAAVAAVDGVDISVPEREFFTLLGPSGCGKSTTLRCVAGLEEIDAGTISIGGAEVSDPKRGLSIPPNERDIGMVFQNYAIWPHMTVRENLLVPLVAKAGRRKKADLDEAVARALAAVQLSGYEDRSATKMSGGQQQRLALARALIHEPSLLLLDEPLSNLDAKLRDDMRKELVSIQRRASVTALYVTHDQAEALSMSDRIAVMNEGRVEQEGTPWEIYHLPSTRFVAEFVGEANFLTGECKSAEGDAYVRVATPLGELTVRRRSGEAVTTHATVMIRPENIYLGKEAERAAETGFNSSAEVLETSFVGQHVEARVRVGSVELAAHCEPLLAPRAGEVVQMAVSSDGASLLVDR